MKRIPDQFIGTDLVIVKGLPWNYSASGVLMKKTGPRKRTAVAADEAEEGEKIELDKAEEQIEEKKAKEASAERQAQEAGMAVALGLATPGLFGGGHAPRFAEKRKAEEPDEEGDPTATSSSSARAPAEAATAAARLEPLVLPPPLSDPGGRKQEEEEESARRAKAMRRSEEAAFHGARRPGEDLSGEESPAKRRGVDEFSINKITVMPHGDSNAWDEIENIGELDMNDWGPEDPDFGDGGR